MFKFDFDFDDAEPENTLEATTTQTSLEASSSKQLSNLEEAKFSEIPVSLLVRLFPSYNFTCIKRSSHIN